jgi:hypothetical protein
MVGSAPKVSMMRSSEQSSSARRIMPSPRKPVIDSDSISTLSDIHISLGQRGKATTRS